MKDLVTLSDDDLIARAAQIAAETDGRQWAQGEVCLEVQRRAAYGHFDVGRYAAAAGRARKTVYAYAQTVSIFRESGLSSWGDFSARFPGCGFTVARDTALRLRDSVAAVSFLEERAERPDIPDGDRWRVESVRASLAGIFNPNAARKLLDVTGDLDTLHESLTRLVTGVRYTLRVWLAEPEVVIVDPFMGSGTTAAAARNLGRHYIGGDLSPEYVAIAQRRLAQPYTISMFPEIIEGEAV